MSDILCLWILRYATNDKLRLDCICVREPTVWDNHFNSFIWQTKMSLYDEYKELVDRILQQRQNLHCSRSLSAINNKKKNSEHCVQSAKNYRKLRHLIWILCRFCRLFQINSTQMWRLTINFDLVLKRIWIFGFANIRKHTWSYLFHRFYSFLIVSITFLDFFLFDLKFDRFNWNSSDWHIRLVKKKKLLHKFGRCLFFLLIVSPLIGGEWHQSQFDNWHNIVCVCVGGNWIH